MSLPRTCPRCGAPVPEAPVGSNVTCPSCRTAWVVRRDLPPAPPVEAIRAPAPPAPRPTPQEAVRERATPRGRRAVPAELSSARPRGSRSWVWLVALGAGLGVAALVLGAVIWLRPGDVPNPPAGPGPGAHQPAGWQKVSSPEGHFQVWMPDRPRQEDRPDPTPAGPPLVLHAFTAEARGDAFAVVWADLPDGTNFDFPRAAQAILGRVGAATSKPLRPIRLFGHEGCEVEADLPNPRGRAILRLFTARKKIYQVITAGPGVDANAADTRRFLDSFTLTDDLLFVARVKPFVAAVVDPPSGTALLATREGALEQYAYPDFKPVASWRPAAPAYQLALDARRGLLYAAGSDPELVRREEQAPGRNPHEGPAFLFDHMGSYRQKGLGKGAIYVYDVKPILRGKGGKGGALRPAAVIGPARTVASLFLSPDGRFLYYLSLGELNKRPWVNGPGPTRQVKAGRINAATRKREREVSLVDGTELLFPAADGRALYATASPQGHLSSRGPEGGPLEGKILVLDPATLRVRDTIAVEADPYDVAVARDGRLFVSGGSCQHTDICVVDVRARAIVARRPGIPEGSYLKLSPNQKRLYLVVQMSRPAYIQSFSVPGQKAEAPLPETQVDEMEGLYPLGEDGVLTPDGRHLLCRTGTVLRLRGGGAGGP